nr:MAG TPA: anaerobic ribonucleoside triphosphate reductase [Caudoviricetes sp.]
MKKVFKRNGTVMNFDKEKIERAISAAYKSLPKEPNLELINKISHQIEEINKDLPVEEIQDIVVKKLMSSSDKDVAMAYQSYRTLKEDLRNKEQGIYKKISNLVDANDSSILNENANKDAKTISVQRDLLAGISSKEFYLNKVLPKHLAEAHIKGELHIHDLDYLVFQITNCELINIENMLKGGCKIGNALMSEPNSVEVAVGHIVQIVASVSSNTFGGCTVPYLDRALVPYIKKSFKKHYLNGLKYISGIEECDLEVIEHDNEECQKRYPKAYKYACDMTEESVKQAMQGLEYEINSLSTVNGQTPFTTVSIGTETSWEGKLVQKYVLKTRMAGFGPKKETAIFPKIVYTMWDGHNFNEEDPNYDISLLAFECMTKSIYPDILFPSDLEIKENAIVVPMGCRAFLSRWIDEQGKPKYAGRFNVGATTINLPRIAIKNKGNEEGFYKELDRVLELAKENSLFRIDYMSKTTSDVAPIMWQNGAICEKKPGETIKDLLYGGYATISIGYIGLSEVSQLLYGKDFSEDEEVHKKTFKILEYLSNKVQEFKLATGVGFALYSTPSESLCDRFASLDLKEFGPIEGITDKGYYDNSFHVSSRINISPFEKLRLEAPGHKLAAGGHISYIETDSLKNNLDAVKDILKYAKSVGIHYMGINQPVDKCHICGYKGEFTASKEGFTCPNCGNHDGTQMSVIRRVNLKALSL